MPRRAGRPESCSLDANDDVCAGCPSAIPPCLGVADRSLCPAIQALAAQMGAEDAAEQRAGKPRGDLQQAIAAARQAKGI